MRIRLTPTALLGVLSGALLGIGAHTFRYAQGLSYFSRDPAACANCHIMQPQLDSLHKSSHHAVATCVDCHLPDSGLAKWVAKAENGYHHSRSFTLQDFHEPIAIGAGNRRILQDNCLRCHQDFVHEIVAGSTTDQGALACVHCHARVGHGPAAGLGGPERADELPVPIP